MSWSLKCFEWLRHYDQEEEANSLCRLLCQCYATSSSQAHSHEAAASKSMGGKFGLLTRLSLSVRICSSLHDFGSCITGGYRCQHGLVFQKDSHHITPWKRVLPPYALTALTTSRLWKQVLHQRRKDNKKHQWTSCHIRCLWPRFIIWMSHTQVWRAFSWQKLRSLFTETCPILIARSWKKSYWCPWLFNVPMFDPDI